jgi:hypothetical protein
MADENVPAGNTAVFQSLALIASAFAAAGAALITTGGFVIGFAALALAIFLLIVGLKWSAIQKHAGTQLVLMVDKAARYRNVIFLFIVSGFIIYGIHFVYNIRSDIDKYVMPRRITTEQSDNLREYSAHHDKYYVKVKVNLLDKEALEYAGQLSFALTQAGWDAPLDTSSGDPNTLNDGLCINTTGENVNPKPFDAKHDPRMLLQQALTAAYIGVTCGSTVGAGE